ncbi:MAG TPA: hypothetical protein VFD41_06650 [Actinomycetales bacterium]|nr:hypothetical protein [Actinomycetales bacterium]
MKKSCLLAIATLAAALIGAPASAEVGQSESVDTHCIATVTADGGASPLTCYDDFRALVRELTGREPRSDLTSRNPTDRDLNPHLYEEGGAGAAGATQAAATVIGISYEDTGFGGSSWVHSVGSGGCTSTTGYSISSLSGTSWDNRISSALTYANCQAQYWEYANFGGALKLCGCSSMQAMNDKTSSIRWRLP